MDTYLYIPFDAHFEDCIVITVCRNTNIHEHIAEAYLNFLKGLKYPTELKNMYIFDIIVSCINDKYLDNSIEFQDGSYYCDSRRAGSPTSSKHDEPNNICENNLALFKRKRVGLKRISKLVKKNISLVHISNINL